MRGDRIGDGRGVERIKEGGRMAIFFFPFRFFVPSLSRRNG